MLRLVLCLLLFGLPAGAAPDHGLIENRTGLSRTLPLQVRTDPGCDVYLVMRDARTTEIAVTAFIEGGRFFRLLMPPGTYTLHVAVGREWQGMEELFGARTAFHTLPGTLVFRAGMTRKRGHLVDLTARDGPAGMSGGVVAPVGDEEAGCGSEVVALVQGEAVLHPLPQNRPDDPRAG